MLCVWSVWKGPSEKQKLLEVWKVIRCAVSFLSPSGSIELAKCLFSFLKFYFLLNLDNLFSAESERLFIHWKTELENWRESFCQQLESSHFMSTADAADAWSMCFNWNISKAYFLFFVFIFLLSLSLSLSSQAFDAFIYIFFALEMVVKMVALGIFGRRCYLGDTWNRLDFFIVMAG